MHKYKMCLQIILGVDDESSLCLMPYVYIHVSDRVRVYVLFELMEMGVFEFIHSGYQY